MKARMIAGMFGVVLVFGSMADACHRAGARHSRGVIGTISSVGKNSLSLSVPSSAGATTLSVKFAAGTHILGSPSHTLSSALIGHTATVVGATERGGIKASEIVIN